MVIGKSSSEYSLGSQVPVVVVKVPFAQDRQPAWSAAEEIKSQFSAFSSRI